MYPSWFLLLPTAWLCCLCCSCASWTVPCTWAKHEVMSDSLPWKIHHDSVADWKGWRSSMKHTMAQVSYMEARLAGMFRSNASIGRHVSQSSENHPKQWWRNYKHSQIKHFRVMRITSKALISWSFLTRVNFHCFKFSLINLQYGSKRERESNKTNSEKQL